MRKISRHIALVLATALCLCSCSREGKVIPRNKFAKIYAEMFLSDTWLGMAPWEAREMADTTFFYAPVFEKYNCTLEDYLASVAYYLQDPDRFSRILKKAGDMLETESVNIQKAQDAEFQARRDSMMVEGSRR